MTLILILSIDWQMAKNMSILFQVYKHMTSDRGNKDSPVQTVFTLHSLTYCKFICGYKRRASQKAKVMASSSR